MGTVQSVHAPRVVSTQRVQSLHVPRVRSASRVRDIHAVRTTAGRVQSLHAPVSIATQEVRSVHSVQNQQWPDEFAKVYLPQYSGTANNYLQVEVSLKLHDRVNNTVDDLTEYLVDWEISQKRSSPATMRVTLSDKNRDLRPILSSGDKFFGKFKGDNFDINYNVRRYWQMSVTVRGETWMSPWFLLLEYEWNYETSATVSLEFIDLSELALQDNFEMEDFVSTPTEGGGGLWTSHSVISAILSSVGIRGHDQRLEFTPYPVLRFSPKGGKALDYIRKILHIRQAEWRFDESKFVAHDRNYNPNGPAMWKFVDTRHIKRVAVKYSVRDLINEVTLKRVEPSNLLGESECTGGDCLGYQTVSLNPPANAATLVLEEVTNYAPSGNFVPVWLDQNGNVRGNGWSYIGDPVSSVQWVYEPKFETVSHESAPGGYVNLPWNGGWVPSYRAVVYGRPLGSANFPQFTSSYTVTVTNSPSQAIYGRRPDRTPIEDVLIPDQDVAVDMGTKIIEESIRTTEVSSWEGPLQPFVLPGQMVEVDITMGGISSRVYYVEQVRKRGNKSGGWMSVEMTKFPD